MELPRFSPFVFFASFVVKYFFLVCVVCVSGPEVRRG
jgi:hypothetical protein